MMFKNIKQYVRQIDHIWFPQSSDKPFLFCYFSENSSFLQDYPRLNLRLIDYRLVVVPYTKLPRTYLSGSLNKQYKNLKLRPYSSNVKVPSGRNIIYDTSIFINKIDSVYHPTNYRQRAGLLIRNALLTVTTRFPNNYQKILVYSVDTTKDISQITKRKIFPILLDLKQNEFSFDHLLLVRLTPEGTLYRSLIKDRSYDFRRVYTYILKIKSNSEEEDIEEDIEKASTEVVNKVQDHIDIAGSEKVKDAVFSYLKRNEDDLDIVSSGSANDEDAKRIASAALLYKVSGDLKRSTDIALSIPKEKQTLVLKNIDKRYVDEFLEVQKTVSLTNDIGVQLYNPPSFVDSKSPEHIFNKRQIDFEKNLIKDMVNSFKVLETKDVPIKIEAISIVNKPQRVGEIEKSDLSIVKTTLKDKLGNVHTIELEIPQIKKDGTFRLNGRKKCLINQIVVCPISFPKEFDSRFESSYSSFHVTSKRSRKKNYLELYFGSYRLPALIVLSYAFGFKETLDHYGIRFRIENTKPRNEKFVSKLKDGKFIIFENVDNEVKEELCNSLDYAKIDQKDINYLFGTKEYFNQLIIQITGRVNSTFLISLNVENIVDPVARQVLANKQLPTNLENIISYMAEKVVSGYSQERNDLSNQRIRNSEVIIHLLQKRILKSYTDFREQILSGSTSAKFTIPPSSVISDFINTEIVMDMEYANPIEEMSTMTRVSPVGKVVGGIPDKGAIQNEARNVHSSYFGNIDPLDTPEGGNIGIVQQLTINSFITSSRGLFGIKPLSNNEHSGMLSTTTCLVPFLENNEGARVIMLSNQAKQMIPLKNPEPPAVQSGYESILTNVLSDSFVKKTSCDGEIKEVTQDSIIVLCKNKELEKIDTTPVHLHSGSGKDTLSTFKSLVKKGDNVKKGFIVAESGCLKDGMISMGKNLCCAIMPYKGYNFEDGIIINERLVHNERLTSLHGIIEEVEISSKDRILKLAGVGQLTKKGEPLIIKTIGEVEELLGFNDEDSDNEEIYSGQYIKKSSGGTIVEIEVFSNLPKGSFPQLEPLIEKTAKKYGKSPKEKFSVRGIPVKGILIRFKIEQELIIDLGDKLCNRYGNKGIISLIEKDSFMPTTPWGDKIDIIINPIGLIARMNIGQLYELYCGLISRHLAGNVISLNKEKLVTLLGKVLSKLDSSKDKKYSSGYIARLNSLGPRQYEWYVSQIKRFGFFPIIVPPFKACKSNEIYSALKILGLETGYKLKLPEFGVTTQNKIPVGYMYFAKLEHIGGAKLHARSTGPVSMKTKQPLAGKRREGGQRLGELDSYGLISDNCPTVLSELMGPMADDHITKNEIISEIIQDGEASYKTPKSSPTMDLLNAYFVALMLSK